MAGKTSEWRPGSTVCRCCLTEGCYKDISTEYFWMGKREVYAEMLSDTLQVSISYAQTGGRLICEPCIARLRDASDFKRQVQDCEKTFMNHLDPSTSKSSVQVEVESLEDVKMERVKVEKDESDDDDDFLPGPDFGDDDDDDDLDDEPLTKLASAKVKVPKKEAVEILDMLDTSQITVKRKASSKTKEPPKKVKKKEVVVKPTTSKAKAAAAEREKKKKEIHVRDVAKRNAEVLLQYTTIYPFRFRGRTFICVHCCDEFEDPEQLRRHRDEIHYKVTNLQTAFAHVGKNREYLKVDIFDLQCRLCAQPLSSIEDAAEHLKDNHNNTDIAKLDLNFEIGVHPYRLELGKLKCQLCDMKYPTMTKLSRHMSSHFTTYTCDICGRRYLNMDNLKYHIKFSHSGKVICRRCKTEFKTIEEKKIHLHSSLKCRPFGCVYCEKRFLSWELKQKHLVDEHNVSEATYKCPDCNKICKSRKMLYSHYTTEHTNQGYSCSCCNKIFGNKSLLDEHMVKHSGEKQYQCEVCLKNFTRKKSLAQHMWIHSEVKRFACFVCNKQFNQKVCYVGHIKTHHPEINTI